MFQTESLLLIGLGMAAALAAMMVFGFTIWAAADQWSTSLRKKEVPTTILDMQAEREQLRAEHAMTARRLEVLLEKARADQAAGASEVVRHRNRAIKTAQDMRTLEVELASLKKLAAELTVETNKRSRIIAKLTGQPVSKLRTFSLPGDAKLPAAAPAAESGATPSGPTPEAAPTLERIKSTIAELHALSAQIASQPTGLAPHPEIGAAPLVKPAGSTVFETATPASNSPAEKTAAQVAPASAPIPSAAEPTAEPLADEQEVLEEIKSAETAADRSATRVISLTEKFKALKGHVQS